MSRSWFAATLATLALIGRRVQRRATSPARARPAGRRSCGNGAITDLGHLGNRGASPQAINNAGQIVGSSYTTEVGRLGLLVHAFLWESYAKDINDAGVVVGTMRAPGGVGNYRAYIYADGVVTNLNNLIPVG